MSLSVDQARYFIPSYAAQNLTSAEQASTATADPAAVPEGDETAVAPPPSHSTQLLASGDMRLLLMRGVNGDGLEGYKGILEQYYGDPANSEDPVAFLKNLSQDGIDLLKQAQSIPAGAQIDVASLSKEQAVNFIVPYSDQVDLDNDGFVSGGNGGNLFKFPPPNAPQDVKDAWDEMTAGMNDRDSMLLSSKFFFKFMSANLQADENGKVTQTQPGEPGWKNIYADEGFSYREAIDEFLAGNEFSKNLNSTEIYERTKRLLTMLDNAFAQHGVA